MAIVTVEITRDQFVEYERIRLSGVTNMFALNTVCELSGLEREEVREIMRNYLVLKEKYPLTEEEKAAADELREALWSCFSCLTPSQGRASRTRRESDMAISITKREAKRAEAAAAIIRKYVPLDRDDKDGRLVKHVNAKIADWRVVVRALDWFVTCYEPGKKKVGI